MISVPGRVSSCVGTGKPVASQHRGVEAVQGGRRGLLVTHLDAGRLELWFLKTSGRLHVTNRVFSQILKIISISFFAVA